MEPRGREAAQRRGRHKVDAMRRRATLLRERVVVTAIVSFVLLWAVVFVQMATGNDPVLAGKTAQRRASKVASRNPERPRPRATPPEEETESEGVQSEAAETERLEVERLEAEELEAVSSGQS